MDTFSILIIRPFHGTAYEENLDPDDFNANMGYDQEVNNRSARFYELMEKYEKIDWQDFLDIKFDHTFVMDTFYFMRDFSIVDVFDVSVEAHPDLADVMEHFNNWNWKSDSLNRNFPVILYTMYENI